MYEKDRTWAEIRLEAVRNNLCALRGRLTPGTHFLGVVKADAYGHGAVPVARTLEEAACDYLAVATLCEARELRDAGISLPILILGWTSPEHSEDIVRSRITQAVSDPGQARALSLAAVKLGVPAKIHLKIDTGMGRTGFLARGGRDPLPELLPLLTLPGLETEGIFTHFAVSETDPEYTNAQAERFLSVVAAAERVLGHRIPLRHCANSGTVLQYRHLDLDMVRPGIALYGVSPDASLPAPDLIPVMTLKSRICQIRPLSPGESVSYGRRYLADVPRRMAVLPIGYADGLFRSLSGKASFLLRGTRVPQIGTICMDMCMLDVTEVPDAAVGDEVTVFGTDPSVSELAGLAGTIPYELLCAVSPRVPRVYL